MKKIDAKPVIDFFKMLGDLQKVTRTSYVPGEDRKENDAEHSYTLALLAWYIIDVFDLDLDKDKAILYALAHDIPEVYAGDTMAFSKDPDVLATQDEREEKARKQLSENFPEITDLHTTMEQYEKREDPESVFVHALDKIQPVLVEYLQDGRAIKENNLTYSETVALKRKVTENSPEISDLLEQLIALMTKDKKRFWGELTS
jgi:putative hydrolase of HD superfamily